MQTLKLTKKYEKYPEYKDSGIEWLGKIPKDWKVVSSRQLFTTAKERVGISFADHKILSLTLQGVVPRVLDGSGKNPAEYDTYQKFRKNDLVFCLFDYDVTPRTIGYVEEDGMMTGAYTRLIPRSETYSKYFFYYFLSLDFSKELLHLCTGLRNSLSKPVFWSMKSSLPSISVQERIVKYLNEKTSYIDRIIENKQKLIELLREKRTAVINNAVTKGLNSKAELVESGIDWIGKIPKGWEIRKIKNFSNIKRGASPRPIDDQKYFDEKGEYSWVRIEDLTASDRYLLNTTQRLSELGKSLSVPLEPGEMFLSIAGSVGKPIITKIKCCIHDGFVCFKNLRCNSEYLYYIFTGGEAYKGLGKLGTQLNLNIATVGNILVPLPPEIEQEAIVNFLDKQVGSYDQLIKRAYRSIELLQEFKSSLISNVVTGKIKV